MTAAGGAAAEPASPGLAARLREATRDAHRRAERSGIMRRLLAGEVERWRYARLLRALHGVYAALESGLDRHAGDPRVAPAADDRLRRAPALAADLRRLHGDGWPALAVAAEGRAYVRHLERLADREPLLLVAHAYVRYLGDLAGGQLLRRLVGRSVAGGFVPTAAYEFPAIAEPAAFVADYRARLDGLPVDAGTADAIVGEAVAAFERHVRLFEELDAAPPDAAAPAPPLAVATAR